MSQLAIRSCHPRVRIVLRELPVALARWPVVETGVEPRLAFPNAKAARGVRHWGVQERLAGAI
jgi:hypothetical protein